MQIDFFDNCDACSRPIKVYDMKTRFRVLSKWLRALGVTSTTTRTAPARLSPFLPDDHRQRLLLRDLPLVYPQRHLVLAERLQRGSILGHHEHASVALELALSQSLAGFGTRGRRVRSASASGYVRGVRVNANAERNGKASERRDKQSRSRAKAACIGRELG